MPEARPSERADGVAITWNSVELAEFLTENGFVSGAAQKRLPDWVLGLPESQRLSLIAGYLDSDGCAPKGKRGFSIKSVNRPLLEDVAEVLTSLGIPGRLFSEGNEGKSITIQGYESRSNGSHRLEFPCDPRLLPLVSEGLADAACRQLAPELTFFRKVGRSNIQLPETVEIRKVEVGEPQAAVPTWDIEVEG
ncbi:MAG: LAGLIDADG family homing endonuclease, partial [Actinomycetota bacterium]